MDVELALAHIGVGVDHTGPLQGIERDLTGIVGIEALIFAEVYVHLNAIPCLEALAVSEWGHGAALREDTHCLSERLGLGSDGKAEIPRSISLNSPCWVLIVIRTHWSEVRHSEDDELFDFDEGRHSCIISIMNTKKTVSPKKIRSNTPRERGVYKSYSMRILKRDLDRLQKKARREKISFNTWMVNVLMEQLAPAVTPEPELVEYVEVANGQSATAST